MKSHKYILLLFIDLNFENLLIGDKMIGEEEESFLKPTTIKRNRPFALSFRSIYELIISTETNILEVTKLLPTITVTYKKPKTFV